MNSSPHHFKQLAASPAEPLVSAIETELLEAGQATMRQTYWSDHAIAMVGDNGTVLAVIVWRHCPDRRSALIAVGGTRTGYRQQGIYAALFHCLVNHLETERPEIQKIESGHHVDNEASREMHKALGRTLVGYAYDFPLSSKVDAR